MGRLRLRSCPVIPGIAGRHTPPISYTPDYKHVTYPNSPLKSQGVDISFSLTISTLAASLKTTPFCGREAWNCTASQCSVARPAGLLSAGGTTPDPLSHTRILIHPPFSSRAQARKLSSAGARESPPCSSPQPGREITSAPLRPRTISRFGPRSLFGLASLFVLASLWPSLHISSLIPLLTSSRSSPHISSLIHLLTSSRSCYV